MFYPIFQQFFHFLALFCASCYWHLVLTAKLKPVQLSLYQMEFAMIAVTILIVTCSHLRLYIWDQVGFQTTQIKTSIKSINQQRINSQSSNFGVQSLCGVWLVSMQNKGLKKVQSAFHEIPRNFFCWIEIFNTSSEDLNYMNYIVV